MVGARYKNMNGTIFTFNSYKYKLNVTHIFNVSNCKYTQCCRYLLTKNLIRICNVQNLNRKISFICN